MIKESSKIPFTPPDPRLTVEDPFGPFTQIIPSLSQYIFTNKLHLLPFDVSYNLPMVVFGSLGILVFYFFLLELLGFMPALFGSIFLGLHPYYFGYLHNNMKDIPNAFAFTLSLWLFWRLTKYRDVKHLILASFAFAFAFNIKINSVFIPVACGIYFFLVNLKEILKDIRLFLINKKNITVFFYFILAPFLAVMLWWPFWRDPWGKLLELPRFYSLNTYNMPNLFMGHIYRSGINIPAFYPFVYLGITAPLLILFFFIIGFVISIYFALKNRKAEVLLLVWFTVPLLRYLSPKASAIDGVRHFLEVLYPFSAIAAFSAGIIVKKLKSHFQFFIIAIIVLILSRNLIVLHPYQTSFFNILIGGIKGANGNFDLDFWGTPQKEAVSFLNKIAPQNSSVHIVMAQSTASLYLRDDLLDHVNSKSIEDSDYVILLNRLSFFDLYGVTALPDQKQKEGKIVYKVDLENQPLVWIFRK